MKTMQQFLQAFLIMTGLFLLAEKSIGQNLNSFSVEVQHTTGAANGKIYLSTIEASGTYTFKLYDLYNTSKEFKKVVENRSLPAGKKELIFSGLPPSGYVIQIIKDGKKSMLGGMNGIIIQ